MPLLTPEELQTLNDMQTVVEQIKNELTSANIVSECDKLLAALNQVEQMSALRHTRNTSAQAKDFFQQCLIHYIRLMQQKTGTVNM